MQKPTRIFWLLSLTFLGVIPVLMCLLWIDGNMTLPGEIHRIMQDKIGWPWLAFEESSVLIRVLIDLSLSLAAFLLARLASRSSLNSPRISRAFTVSTFGFALFCVMSCWQFTGIILWSLRVPLYFSDALYWALLAVTFFLSFRRLKWDEVLGYAQIYSETSPSTPMEILPSKALALLALAFVATPVLSLDRLLFSLVTVLFLIFLIKFRRLSIANSPW